MRRGIREATKQGFTNVAVVCGAWHAPALEKLPAAAADDRILRGLPRAMKTAAAWVPWTFERLAAESGYGAGIESPGWYEHLWSGTEPLAVSWMAKVARVFREEGLDASAAHLIEAVRLAETLAAMRGRSVPSLAELNEAVRACLAMGSDLPLELVRDRLIVGRVMGETPADAPVAPLAADLERQTRRLRMRPEPGQKTIDLDLRSETDLARSHLLHRLGILGVPWGQTQQVRGKSGTFHEVWALAWQPEFVVDLVAASRFGNTIEEAATDRDRVANAGGELPALTALIEAVLLAELARRSSVVDRIGDVAAVGADVPALMDALPPLARVLRYGNVRGHRRDRRVGGRRRARRPHLRRPVERGRLARRRRRCRLREPVDGVHGAIALLDDADDRAAWREALHGCSTRTGSTASSRDGRPACSSTRASSTAPRRHAGCAWPSRPARTRRSARAGSRASSATAAPSCSTTRTCSTPSTAGSRTCRRTPSTTCCRCCGGRSRPSAPRSDARSASGSSPVDGTDRGAQRPASTRRARTW